MQVLKQAAWYPVTEDNLPDFEQIVATFSEDGEVKIDQLLGFLKTKEGVKYHWKTSDPILSYGGSNRKITHWVALHIPEPPRTEA